VTYNLKETCFSLKKDSFFFSQKDVSLHLVLEKTLYVAMTASNIVSKVEVKQQVRPQKFIVNQTMIMIVEHHTLFL